MNVFLLTVFYLCITSATSMFASRKIADQVHKTALRAFSAGITGGAYLSLRAGNDSFPPGSMELIAHDKAWIAQIVQQAIPAPR